MTTPDDHNDDDNGTLTLEEIAAEAHRHRPRISRRETPSSEVGELPTFPRRSRPSAKFPAVVPPPPPPPELLVPQPQVWEDHDEFDDDLLHRAVADAGRWAYGTVLVEVWVNTGTSLIRPSSGWWLDPIYYQQGNDETSGQLRRLVDEERPDYVPPSPLVPGEGLPGVLWAELERGNTSRGTRLTQTQNSRRRSSGGIFRSIQQQKSVRSHDLNQSRSGSTRGGHSSRFRSRGNSISSHSSSKRRGHRRAMSVPVASPDERQQGSEEAIPTMANDQFDISRIWNMSFRSRGQASNTGSVHAVSTTGPERKSRWSRRTATDIEGAVFAAAVADEELRKIEIPVVVPAVSWRDVKALANDPDQPWNPRLKLLADCNIGWAAAVPLRRHGHAPHGLVIYMARGNVDGKRLRSPTNETYLISAADLISSALLTRGPRHAVIEERRAELARCIRRVRYRLLFLLRQGHCLEELAGDSSKMPISKVQASDKNAGEFSSLDPVLRPLYAHLIRSGYWLREKLATTLLKTRGGSVQTSPGFSWQQTAVTFVATLLTIATVTWLNTHLVSTHGKDVAVLLGPFGALVTLLYGLTAAPASQPRNAILGQTVSVGTVLLLQYIPRWESMSIEWRAALSTALAVSAMVRLGFIHPPAGAAALLFALDPDFLDGAHFAVLLLANAVAIGMAVILNNLSDHRQYPTYWGVRILSEAAKLLQTREKEQEAKLP